MRAVARGAGLQARAGLLLVAALAVRTASAATGGPDELGTTWFDDRDGCPFDPPEFTAAAQRVTDPAGPLGPLPLGFTMPFAGGVATELVISPTGFVAFSGQGAAGGSAVTQLLPDPAAPNHLVAPFWKPVGARVVTAEAFPDRFDVEWQFDGGGPLGTEPTWLRIHRDGRLVMSWGNQRFSIFDATVGYEDAAGALGTTYWRDGTALEAGFPDPLSQRSACLVPAPGLDCTEPVAAACGDVVDVALPDAVARQARAYPCADGDFPAHERLVEVDVPRPRAVVVTVDRPDLDLFFIGGPSDCGESLCTAHADQSLAFPVLFRGTHRFAVDGASPGGGVTARVSVDCADLPVAECGRPLPGTTQGASAEDSYACVPSAVLDRPESHALVTTVSDGHLSVVLPGAPPGLFVVLRDEDGTCLAAGRGGAAVFDAPAGTYVVTVDGEAGASGDFALQVSCGTGLDCRGAVSVSCPGVVLGDTSRSTRDGADIHACSGEITDGAEDVFLLMNPREQLLSARLRQGQPGQAVYLLSECDEGRCVFGELQGSCSLLPAGEYLLVVDGPAGSEGPYELELDCRLVASPGVDLGVVAVDVSALGSGCRDLDVDGTVLVSVANGGADASPAPFDVVVFLDADGGGRYDGGDTLLGRVPVDDPVPAGEVVTVPVPASGTLPFRDAVVHAEVDPDRAVPDLDLSDQALDTGSSCVGPGGPAAPLSLRLEWEWTASPVAPSFVEVEAVPLVADLTGNGRPEVIVTAQECRPPENTGTIVRALSGADGSELWSAPDPGSRLAVATAPAAGDLDGDGRPEIVGQSHEDPTRLIALDADGGLLWTSDPLAVQSPFDTWGGSAAVADLDGDGRGEVVWGPSVLAFDGQPFWTAEAGGTFGAADGGPMSVVADLDGDGVQEVIAGPTAYRLDAASGTGRIAWRAEGVPDGYAAVGELDGDAELEVLVAEHARLHRIEGDTGAVTWSIDLPVGGGAPCGGISGFAGGPPTLADLDGDGRAEIGVMSADWYVVVDASGALLWAAPAAECSSGITSATVFDLDGDGAPEVMLKDQDALRVLRGADGTELLVEPGTSGTSREMPVVADVDGDGEAEIVVVENRLLGGTNCTGLAGVRVFGSGGAPWIGARSVWNQHAYHVTNVHDDLSLPLPTTIACAPPSPRAAGSFRVQRARPRGGPLLPDLTLMLLEAERLGRQQCDQELRVVVRVGNGGGALSPPFDLALFDGDPAAGGRHLTSVAGSALAPGEWIDLEARVLVSASQPVEVHVVADADPSGASLVSECREDNNTCVVTDADVGGVPPSRPSDVGPVLRAVAHGDPHAADAVATFDWSLDVARPLGTGAGEQHYHVSRGRLGQGAPLLAPVPGSEPWLAVTLDESTPAAPPAELPRVHGYRVVAADWCEVLSLD